MIIITTPTGQIGSQLLPLLIANGAPLRVIARDPAKLPDKARGRVEVVEGTHYDPDVVDRAFVGADAVFWVTAPDDQADDIAAHYLDTIRPAIAALRAHEVPRVVSVSTMGRGWTGNAGLLSATLQRDALLEGSGVHHRALAMPSFMDNLLWQLDPITTKGTFFMVNDAQRPLAAVATRDVAAAAATVLGDLTWTGQQSLAVVGPDHLSPSGMAEVVSDVLRREVTMVQVPVADYKETMVGRGSSPAWAQGLVDMASAQDAGIYAEQWASAHPAPTSFREFCEQTLKPAAA